MRPPLDTLDKIGALLEVRETDPAERQFRHDRKSSDYPQFSQALVRETDPAERQLRRLGWGKAGVGEGWVRETDPAERQLRLVVSVRHQDNLVRLEKQTQPKGN